MNELFCTCPGIRKTCLKGRVATDTLCPEHAQQWISLEDINERGYFLKRSSRALSLQGGSKTSKQITVYNESTSSLRPGIPWPISFKAPGVWPRKAESRALNRSKQGLPCTQETKDCDAGECGAHGSIRKRAEAGGFSEALSSPVSGSSVMR